MRTDRRTAAGAARGAGWGCAAGAGRPGGLDWLRAAGGGTRGDGLPGRPRCWPLRSAAGSDSPAQVCRGIPHFGGPPRLNLGGVSWGGARASGSPAGASSLALSPARAPGARGGGQVLACASPSCPAPGPRFRRPGADGRRPARLPARGRVCSDGRGSQSWRGEPAPAGDLPWALCPGTQDPQSSSLVPTGPGSVYPRTHESRPPVPHPSDPPVPPEPSAFSAPRCLLPGPGRAEPVARYSCCPRATSWPPKGLRRPSG